MKRKRYGLKPNPNSGSVKAKPVVKVFATLALSSAVGQKIWELETSKGDAGNNLLASKARILWKLSFENTWKYPSKSMTQARVKDVESAVIFLLSGEVSPELVLSMLIAGLCDIHEKCSPHNKTLVDEVITAVRECLNCYLRGEDDELESDEAAIIRYNAWLEYLNGNFQHKNKEGFVNGLG